MTCVSCGAYVPEGRMVCKECERKAKEKEEWRAELKRFQQRQVEAERSAKRYIGECEWDRQLVAFPTGYLDEQKKKWRMYINERNTKRKNH